MALNVVPMATGILRSSSIQFVPDLGNANTPAVPLGVMVELHIPEKMRGLGLIGRKGLTEFEKELIGEFGLRVLGGSPYEYLSQEFDLAWDETEPGGALNFLCERHRQSLLFKLPISTEVPRRLFVDGKPVRSLVHGFMLESLEDSAFELTPLRADDFGPEQANPQSDLIAVEAA